MPGAVPRYYTIPYKTTQYQHLNSVKPKAQVYDSELKGFYDFQYKIDMYTLFYFKEVSKMYLVNI